LLSVFAVVYLAARRAGDEGLAFRPERADALLVEGIGASAPRALASVRGEPADVALALRLARAQIDSARATGDLRPLGRAEALLAPFAEPARADELVLRATIAQARHEFGVALSELEQALLLDPSDAQAHLTRAALLTVLGRYREARAGCAPLAALAPRFVHTLCWANVAGYSGERAQALAAFEQALSETRLASERAWALSLLCEHAYWGGDLVRAERACRDALALDPGDRYTRGLYADVLLEAGQPGRALALLPDDGKDDALLLRRALCALALAHDDAPALVAALQARFAASRARGDRVHQREEARLLLALGREPARALRLAREGFAAQREPWDVRLLLRAAQAAGDPRAAQPALLFRDENRLESPLLATPVARAGSPS
jgi:tetratricopeptide (TPR) repeat protein